MGPEPEVTLCLRAYCFPSDEYRLGRNTTINHTLHFQTVVTSLIICHCTFRILSGRTETNRERGTIHSLRAGIQIWILACCRDAARWEIRIISKGTRRQTKGQNNKPNAVKVPGFDSELQNWNKVLKIHRFSSLVFSNIQKLNYILNSITKYCV